jgi:hypothetical protein
MTSTTNTNTSNTNNSLNIIKRQGEYFGYPKCCVKAFIRRISGKGTKDVQLQAARAGFIPCAKHADLILKNEVEMEDLVQKKRICSVPFSKEKISIYEIEFKKSERFKVWLKMVQMDEMKKN